jgi:glutamate-1-semialdehyde 2,1-aminomutase
MDWNCLESDRELFERELATFVPPRLFDAHAHLYENSQFGGEPPPLCARGPASTGWATYQARIANITPDRQTSGLFFGFPSPRVDFAAANDFLIREARRDPNSRGQMLVHPSMDPEFIRETVRREGFVGLKCYHVYAPETPTYDAPIPSYLPEAQVRVAHEEGLSITLHMVRARAMADPSNQQVIRLYAERYPTARFILAHAARGFNPHHTVEGISALRGLRNIWCDTSAVTDSGAFEAIIHTLGVDRLLYGSDFPVSHLRGRCVAIGDSFLWLSADNTAFNAPYGPLQPALVGLESLRTLKLACMSLRLSDSDVERIFHGNAAELFGLGG